MIQKSILFMAIVALFFTSCQKEKVELTKQDEQTQEINENVVLTGDVTTPALINGETLEYNIKREKAKGSTKGLVDDESIYLQTGTAYTVGSTEQYQVLKVYRDPYNPVDSFYIMIENLRYNSQSSDCVSYTDTITDSLPNVNEYGYLYSWEEANNARSSIYMRLPKTVNGRTRNIARSAELPTIEDIKDLSETTKNISYIADSGVNILGGEEAYDLYYDAFIAGLDFTQNYEDAYHSLAGWRNNSDFDYLNQNNAPAFYHINQMGRFWLNEFDSSSGGTDFYYPLFVSYNETSTTYQMSAYVPVPHASHYGFAVRYVFYPFE